jgi:hypothetical protein
VEEGGIDLVIDVNAVTRRSHAQATAPACKPVMSRTNAPASRHVVEGNLLRVGISAAANAVTAPRASQPMQAKGFAPDLAALSARPPDVGTSQERGFRARTAEAPLALIVGSGARAGDGQAIEPATDGPLNGLLACSHRFPNRRGVGEIQRCPQISTSRLFFAPFPKNLLPIRHKFPAARSKILGGLGALFVPSITRMI